MIDYLSIQKLQFCKKSILSFLLLCYSQCFIICTDVSNVFCPPYKTYLKSGNTCVFLFEKCGNYSDTIKKCNNKLSNPVSMIYNEGHYKDLCTFLSKRVSNGTSFYLGVHKESGQFLWDMDNSNVRFTKYFSITNNGNECLELVVSKSKNTCLLRDTPCSKSNVPLCEYSYVNPCLHNNGGCQGSCTPRHRGERKCSCPPGQYSKGTRCIYDSHSITNIKCPASDSFYSKLANLCVPSTTVTMKKNEVKKACFNLFGKASLGIASLINEYEMDYYCFAIRESQNASNTSDELSYHINGYYNAQSKTNYWDQLGSSIPKTRLCTHVKQRITTSIYSNCVVLRVSKQRCCIQIVACHVTMARALCKILPPNECHNWPTFGNCSDGLICVPKAGYRKYTCDCPPEARIPTRTGYKCNRLCRVKNGGCAHSCHNLRNGRKCSCWHGFELYGETECRYKDKCMANEGVDGCPLHFVGSCENKIGNPVPPDKGFSTLNIILLTLLFILVTAAIYASGAAACIVMNRTRSPSASVEVNGVDDSSEK